MQGLTPLVIVSKGLQSITLPPLVPPKRDKLVTTDEGKETFILWGIKYCVYSVIAHLRTVLRGLIVLAESGNIPTAFVVCRHVFEWAAQICYMNETLAKHVAAKDWDAARDLLNRVAIGSKWIKEHGHKYDPNQVTADIPDTIRLKTVLVCYENHLRKNYGIEAKDDYGHLSEHSHPNSACLQQYHDTDFSEVRFIEPSAGSPLPVVNWCLIDITTLLLNLLSLSGEQIVRPQIDAIATELTKLASEKVRL